MVNSLGVITEEFAALHEHAASIEESRSTPPEFEQSEARLRSELWETLTTNCDFWIDTLGNGVCLLADAHGEETGKRTALAMRFFRTKSGSRFIGHFEVDVLNQCRLRPTKGIESYGSPPTSVELSTDALMKLARLSVPELGKVREMGDAQYAAMSRGQNEHLRGYS